jgi:UTP--glucose-1-phosphate uridylyltransferase
MLKQAIIPLAGLGTRLLPLSSITPKELLPINGKSNLEHVLDECIDAGVKEFILIISKRKEAIKKYFFNDQFYMSVLAKKKDKRISEAFKKLKKYQKMIKFVYQNKPKGTGDAILKCKRYIKDSHFLMLFPDDLIIKKNCSKEMIALHKKTKGSIIATKAVKKNLVSRYGILSLKKKIKNTLLLKTLLKNLV